MGKPDKPPRTRLLPESRRAQLLDCAIAASAQHGIARVTHAHVAERAQVSVPTVHSYFRTRTTLVSEMLEELEIRLWHVIDAAMIEDYTARQGLTVMVQGFDQAARDASDVIKVWLDWSTGIRADVWPGYLHFYDGLHAAIGKILLGGKTRGELSPTIDVDAAARLFIGGGHTIALARFAGVPSDEISILIDHLVDSIMSIRARGGAGTAGVR